MIYYSKNERKIKYIVKITLHYQPEFRPLYKQFYSKKEMDKEIEGYISDVDVNVEIFKASKIYAKTGR
jgi:hypothetical protein